MSYINKFPDWEQRVLTASATSKSASEAATKLGVKFDTYKKYAIRYNCFLTNQSGKGTTKNNLSITFLLSDILDGKYPQYQSNKLRIRLLEENILEHKCNNCLNTVWLNNPIPLELNHINGVSSDHRLINLELLCPNCHSLTISYRGRNTKIH